ncbi:unnamed protein product, partial [Allacma fusca]
MKKQIPTKTKMVLGTLDKLDMLRSGRGRNQGQDQGEGRGQDGRGGLIPPQDQSRDQLLDLVSNLIQQNSELLRNMNPGEADGERSVNLNIRTDYKLTSHVRYDVWYDNFTSELSALNLLDIVEPTTPPPRVFTQGETQRRKAKVRHILINRIDETYHNKIISIRDPYEALLKIREFRIAEINTTSSTLLKQLEDVRFSKRKESVAIFAARFEAAVEKYEMLSSPLDNSAKCNRFIIAVREEYDQFELTAENRFLTKNYEELYKLALWFEANEKDKGTWKSNVSGEQGAFVFHGRNRGGRGYHSGGQNFNSDWQGRGRSSWRGRGQQSGRGGRGRGFGRFQRNEPRNEPRTFFNDPKQHCYNCGANRHKSHECPIDPNSGIKFCYKCKRYATHISSSCKGMSSDSNNPPRTDRVNDRNEAGVAENNIGGAFLQLQRKSKSLISFIADSGACEHLIKDRDALINIRKPNNRLSLIGASNDSNLVITTCGDLLVCDEKNKVSVLSNVLYSDKGSENLLSLRKFTDLGYSVLLNSKVVRIFDPETNETIINGVYRNNLWFVEFELCDEKQILEFCNETKFIMSGVCTRKRNYDHNDEPDVIQKKMVRLVDNETPEVLKKSEGFKVHENLGFPANLWPLAVEAATYVLNRTCHKGINFEIPLSKFDPRDTNEINHLARFGCVAYRKVLKRSDLRKFDSRTYVQKESPVENLKRYFLIGYESNCYKLLDIQTGEIVKTRDVRLNRGVVHKDVSKILKMNAIPLPDDELNYYEWFSDEISELEALKRTSLNKPFTRLDAKKILSEKEEIKSDIHQKLLALALLEDHGDVQAVINKDPVSYADAISREDCEKWREAVNDENLSMKNNDVWDLIQRDEVEPHEKVMSYTWVFRKKISVTGE